MTMKGISTLALLLLAASTSISTQSFAEEAYPSRRVTIIVGLTAGTPADTLARVIADKLTERSGQPFIVENKLGAGTSIAAGDVAKSPPDGYRLYISTNANTTNPNFNKLSFDFGKDLVPVTMIAEAPLVLAVNPSMPATIAEFIKAAKQNPNKYSYGSSGVGTATHLFAALFAYDQGIKLVHVPYKGSSQTVTDLLGGRIQVMFSPAGTVVPQIKAGRLRGLAVSGHNRLADLPNVPTFAEAGIKGFDTAFWFGLNAPAGTPASTINWLNREVGTILKLPEVREKLLRQTLFPTPSTSAAFGDFISQDLERWSRLIKAAKIAPNH